MLSSDKKNWENNIDNRALDHNIKQCLNLKEIKRNSLMVEIWKLKKFK
jgi:hypothetical protein